VQLIHKAQGKPKPANAVFFFAGISLRDEISLRFGFYTP
jgi:hypothetical protein